MTFTTVALQSSPSSDGDARTLRRNYARALYEDTGATLNDVREAVTILEDIAGTSRRVIGGAHPLTEGIESHLRKSRAALRARETLSSGSA